MSSISSNVIRTPLMEFEKPLEDVFSADITPIIIDPSDDNKILTYYSYQHTEILECKKLISDYLIKKVPLEECLDYCRRLLVNSMKHGKTLIINLGNTAADFIHTFNDESLWTKNPSQRGLHYFPLDVFSQGGRLMRENDWPMKLFRETDMQPHKNFAICRYHASTVADSQIDLIFF
jgi:hypothetical protein